MGCPPPEGSTAKPRSLLSVSPLLALAILLAYLPGGLLLDDFFHLDRARLPLGWNALQFAIHTDEHGIVLWTRAEPVHLDFLRPASSLSFWLEFRLWGLRAWGYHLDNVLLHLANVVLLFLLAKRLGLSRGTSAWVAAAWGVSLAAAPAAGWISGRTELLCGFFTLLSVLAFDLWRFGGSFLWLVAALVAVSLAPLAKESGVAAPVLVMVVSRWGSKGPRRTRHVPPWVLLLLFLPALAYLGVRFVLLHVPPPPSPYLDPLASITDVLWLAMKPALYAVTAMFSLPLSHVSPLSPLRHALGALLVGAAAFAVFRPLWRAAGSRRAVLLLAWFVAALLPYLPILPTSLYLYLPFAGLALLIGVARDRHAELRWPKRWLVALTVAGASWQLVIATFTVAAASALDRSVAEAVRICRRDGPDRLVVFDTPVWAYALPAAVRVHDPALHPEIWLVNFSPTVRPGRGSTLRWLNPLLLEARPAQGRYFDSPFERFLLFGGSPADTTGHVRSGVLQIRPDSLVDRPGAIRVQFRDSTAIAHSAVLQFLGWRLTRPEPAAPGLHAGPASTSERRLDRPDTAGLASPP